MAMYAIRKATHADAEFLAPRLRDIDKREVWATSHLTPLEALLQGVDTPRWCWTGLRDGVPVCIFGVSALSLLDGTGVPWLLGTEGLDAKFLIKGKAIVRLLQKEFPNMVNYVHVDNKKSIRWLKWVGFTIDSPAPFGKEGEMFHRFWVGKGSHLV